MDRRALLFLLAACDIVDGGPPEAEPPPPPQSVELPAVYADTLPKDDQGRPIMIAFGSMGYGLEVVHDATLDDAVARWGECLGRVGSCYGVNRGRDIAGCVLAIQRCTDNSGGSGCCPSRCLNEFEAAYDDHGDTERAIEQTIAQGACVDGFPVEVMP